MTDEASLAAQTDRSTPIAAPLAYATPPATPQPNVRRGTHAFFSFCVGGVISAVAYLLLWSTLNDPVAGLKVRVALVMLAGQLFAGVTLICFRHARGYATGFLGSLVVGFVIFTIIFYNYLSHI